jgi:hypothetical protein
MTRKIKASSIATGVVTSALLDNSGVTAASYGSSTAIPVLAIDAKGRVTSASTAALPSNLATETYVNTAVSNLVASAPGALNTLDELAAALNDDANFASTITTSLGSKVDRINITGASVGSATQIPVITFNAQGQITATSTAALDLSTKVDKINITGSSVGSASAVPVITYNAQGQITSTSTAALGALAARATVNGSFIDNGSITSPKLASSGRFSVATAARNSGQSLGGDSGWNDHLSVSFTCGVACRIMIIMQVSSGYESGAVQGFMRILVDGSKVGYNWCAGKQNTANAANAGSGLWHADVSAGSHTVMIQARNIAGGSTWITPYFNADGEGANTLGVFYYE